MYLTCFRNLVS